MRRLTLLTNPDKCNLCCPLCFLNQRGKPFGMGEMPIEIAKAAIEKYAGDAGDLPGKETCGLREVIPSTMGEPLLYSKFEELLDCCCKKNIPLNLTTNGTFPGIWGSAAGMERLLLACSDIKVSCMGFDAPAFDEMMPGIAFESWRRNVERLLDVAHSLNAARSTQASATPCRKIATVSLQVTLHKKLVPQATEILAWAENAGVDRIKWNLPVFLSGARRLRDEYGIDGATVKELRSLLKSPRVRCEGSLFFGDGLPGKVLPGNVMPGKVTPANSPAGVVPAGAGPCDFFKDEIWILPDGTEEYCPNPERRFGDRESAGATCEKCVLCLVPSV